MKRRRELVHLMAEWVPRPGPGAARYRIGRSDSGTFIKWEHGPRSQKRRKSTNLVPGKSLIPVPGIFSTLKLIPAQRRGPANTRKKIQFRLQLEKRK